MQTTRRRFLSQTALGGLASLGLSPLPAQDAPPAPRPAPVPPVLSPEIHGDRSITFRLRAPNARQVAVSGEWGGGNVPLTRSPDGVWSAQVGPLEPELYGYSFIVDGLRVCDPANPQSKPMRAATTSILDLPGQPPLLHDWQDVPHGTVHVHHYLSKATGALRRLHVYTPPGHGERRGDKWPVLFLLHGSGDNDATWTTLGRAHWIADNLLARRECMPAVIVMTDGHLVERRTDTDRWRNVEALERDLLNSVLPFVETRYALKSAATARAIAGLSMGGQQALATGLRHPETFAWVGGMSSGVREPEKLVPADQRQAGELNRRLKLLWVACGREDSLAADNRRFSSLLTEKGVRHRHQETPGNHSWPVWRKYLAEFLPLLFRS